MQARNLEGIARRAWRSETPLGAASDSPLHPNRLKEGFSAKSIVQQHPRNLPFSTA
jgi:hypothetical protein